MNTNTTDTFDPAAMRMTRAAAAKKGLLPPHEQAGYDRQKKAIAFNTPVHEQIKLAKLRESTCTTLLPQLVINLCTQGLDADLIDERIDIARAAINDILDDVHHEKAKTVTALQQQLLPEHGPTGFTHTNQ